MSEGQVNLNFSQDVVTGTMAILSRRYASALYELATDEKLTDVVLTDLAYLSVAVKESEIFRRSLSDPRLRRSHLASIVRLVGETASLNSLTKKYLGLLASKRRLNLLVAVYEEYLEILTASRGEFSAEAHVAEALTPEQHQAFLEKLGDLTGGKVHLTVREDKTLLGGLKVKIGSRLIDASVKGKIDRLKRQLKTQVFSVQKGAA